MFAVHGVGGVFGAIATGVFATTRDQPATGLIDGNPPAGHPARRRRRDHRATPSSRTFVIVKVVDFVLGIRVPAQAEEVGLDIAVHGEVAYQA